jgi:hypothetical protein
MYRELRDRDRIITLNLISAELKRLDRSVQGISLGAIRRHIWRHINKHGVVQRRVTHVDQNTRYDQSVIQGWVSYVDRSIKIGNYKACDVVNIDETNVNLDIASGTTLAGSGERTIGCATTGSSAKCTVLIVITMDGEKLPPFIIYKGKNTSRSLIKRECKDLDARQKFGYPEGKVYISQAKDWMDERAMIKWVDKVRGPYTKDPRRDGRDNYLLQDEFSVKLMGYVKHQINKLGNEVDIIPGGYNGSVQVLDKGVNKPCKGYLRDQFEDERLAP